jgi:hypothetical protein
VICCSICRSVGLHLGAEHAVRCMWGKCVRVTLTMFKQILGSQDIHCLSFGGKPVVSSPSTFCGLPRSSTDRSPHTFVLWVHSQSTTTVTTTVTQPTAAEPLPASVDFHYFAGRGPGETSRMLLAAAEVTYNNITCVISTLVRVCALVGLVICAQMQDVLDGPIPVHSLTIPPTSMFFIK